MLGKNWMGQSSHEVDSYCWFKTTPEEREEMRELFEGLIGDDHPECISQRKHLIKLIDMVRTTAVTEAEFFSQGD